jgi:hypothetical protein
MSGAIARCHHRTADGGRAETQAELAARHRVVRGIRGIT